MVFFFLPGSVYNTIIYYKPKLLLDKEIKIGCYGDSMKQGQNRSCTLFERINLAWLHCNKLLEHGYVIYSA